MQIRQSFDKIITVKNTKDPVSQTLKEMWGIKDGI